MPSNTNAEPPETSRFDDSDISRILRRISARWRETLTAHAPDARGKATGFEDDHTGDPADPAASGHGFGLQVSGQAAGMDPDHVEVISLTLTSAYVTQLTEIYNTDADKLMDHVMRTAYDQDDRELGDLDITPNRGR
ncbi:MAG: hypothetical protein HKM93_09665 [Desulfobacteraceae bacterium]|nr:hypothetical protein [Desulfobacteraceae bacterium]